MADINSITAVDMFCGAGGLTHGLEKAGINVTAGYDIDPLCEFPYNYNNNAGFVHKSIENTQIEEVTNNLENANIKIIVGCAPCQPFSTYSRRYVKREEKPQNWYLLNDFLRIIQGVDPEIVSMENVVQIKEKHIYKEFHKKLCDLGYFVSTYDVDCRNYGIPQSRKRLVLFASKFKLITLSPPSHNEQSYLTVRDTIYDLEPLNAGESSTYDRLHRCYNLSKLNLERIRSSKPGGTWRDWSEAILAKCHNKETGKYYTAVYGRMEWDKPSPTITTQSYSFGSGRFGHPEQDRAISLREAALLQTFPVDYQFVRESESVFFKPIGRLIGNAVPVRLGEVVGNSILEHLQDI